MCGHTQVAVFIHGRVVLVERPVVDGLVPAEKVVRDGHGEDGAAPSVRPGRPDQRRVIGQQHP